MRRLFVMILATLLMLAFGATPLLAGDSSSHSCKKAGKTCCSEKADCCKVADAKCCADTKACCDDATCCKVAEDGSHSCTMKTADGSACKAPCCEKGCAAKKTS